jgi:hypothetical protein
MAAEVTPGKTGGAAALAQEAADHFDGGGFAHAVATHEGDNLAFADREAYIKERLTRAVRSGDLAERQERHGATASLSSPR